MDIDTLRAMAKLMAAESDEPDDIRGLRARAVAWAVEEIDRLQKLLALAEPAMMNCPPRDKIRAELARIYPTGGPSFGGR